MSRLLNLIASTFCTGLLCFSAQSVANIESSMDGLFTVQTQSPATIPSNVRDASGREGVHFGSIRMRTPIKKVNLINFSPPSISSGCNGVDIVGASFSIVSMPEMIALFRSVAANALTYSFKLALKALCQSCAATLESIAKKIAAFNRHFRDSCQMAMGLVDKFVEDGGMFEQGVCNVMTIGDRDHNECMTSANKDDPLKFNAVLESIDTQLAGLGISSDKAMIAGNATAVVYNTVGFVNQISPDYKKYFFGTDQISDYEVSLTLIGGHCNTCPAVNPEASAISTSNDDPGPKNISFPAMVNIAHLLQNENTGTCANGQTNCFKRYECNSVAGKNQEYCNNPKLVDIKPTAEFGQDKDGNDITNATDFFKYQQELLIDKFQAQTGTPGAITFTSAQATLLNHWPEPIYRAFINENNKSELITLAGKMSELIVNEMALQLLNAVIRQRKEARIAGTRTVDKYETKTGNEIELETLIENERKHFLEQKQRLTIQLYEEPYFEKYMNKYDQNLDLERILLESAKR